MAAITASDVSVSIPPQDREIVPPPAGRKMMNLATITFGDGAKTYPTGGVPLPDKGQFGFRRQIRFVAIQQPAGNGFVYKYDPATHKIKIYTQGITTGATAATTCAAGALAKDSGGVQGAVRFSGTAASTAYDLGGMIELPATVAPASVSLDLLMVGE